MTSDRSNGLPGAVVTQRECDQCLGDHSRHRRQHRVLEIAKGNLEIEERIRADSSIPVSLVGMLQTALETAACCSTYLRLAPAQCTAKGSANEAIS